MPKITINVDEPVLKKLKSRAKKNLLSIREQIEDIIRRSMINYSGRTNRDIKIDDRLVSVFSRKKKSKRKK